MLSVVYAALPVNPKDAHIRGGESTLITIDDVFWDSITLIFKLNFIALVMYILKISQN